MSLVVRKAGIAGSCGLMLVVLGCAPVNPQVEQQPIPVVSADKGTDNFDGEVEFPKLPKGAGSIDADAPREFTTTNSGLKYRILRVGDGKKPTVLNTVEAHYHGWLNDGTVFDSSYQRGERATFPLSRVVQGWQEGVPYCAQGGMIELIIPSKLGYGSQTKGKIPPHSTLHFIVELKSIK